MEKEQIFYLVTKKISGEATSDDVIRLQNLLQDYLGVSETHKIFLHLYNIESLISASHAVQYKKWDKTQSSADVKKKKTCSLFHKKAPSPCLSRQFFIRNPLFQVYCTLTLRQLQQILYYRH